MQFFRFAFRLVFYSFILLRSATCFFLFLPKTDDSGRARCIVASIVSGGIGFDFEWSTIILLGGPAANGHPRKQLPDPEKSGAPLSPVFVNCRLLLGTLGFWRSL